MLKRKSRKRFKRSNPIRPMLMLTMAVLLVVLIITAAVYFNTPDIEDTIAEDFSFETPISIAGVEITGLGETEALLKLEPVAREILLNKTLSFSAGDKDFNYPADALGVYVDTKATLMEAYNYERLKDKYPNKEAYKILDEETGRVDFYLKPVLDKKKAFAVIKSDTEEINREPKDATMKLTEDDDNPKIEYIPDEKGVTVDLETLLAELSSEVTNATFAKITAPVKITDAHLTIEKLKDQVSKIGSYTSSFSEGSLAAKGRVQNIVMMSDKINGVEIMPGQTWSMNEQAGPRTLEGGWALAPGIENGVYTDQPGGGVCQVSSTLYNAALEAELEIVNSKRHSWPSGYIPTGLDATISTGGPDLVIQNNKSTPVFVISAVDKKNKTCTVDIYGEKPSHGYKVKYISKIVKTEAPPLAVVRNSTVDQNGKELPINTSKLARAGKEGIYAKIYKQYLDSDDNVVECIFAYDAKYSARGPVYYENAGKGTDVAADE